jgi:hypothetical protein
MARKKGSLHTMPGRTAKEDAQLALIGADYHLQQLKTQLESGLSDNDQIMLFHWHLRGFFWELVAVRDSVRRDAKTDKAIQKALQALEAAKWFREVNEYRNFAHQSFHIVEVLFVANRARYFQMRLRDGDGLSHLTEYLNEMRKFFKII